MARRSTHRNSTRALAACCLLQVALVAGSASADDVGGEDLDDVMGGFEEEDERFRRGSDDDGPIVEESWWDISGSLVLGGSYNYLSHRTVTPKMTQWKGLSRLRTRLNLQLDVDLPREWRMRMAGFVFYDFAYLIEGIHRFENQVLDTYEWERDFQEAWLQGSLLEDLDLKIGRQIVIWGRSDTLRVLDILNPLDNRVPGLAELEDIRRPLGMAKLDYHVGAWTLTGMAIPEIRFNQDFSFGSDFYPLPVPPPHEDYPRDFHGNTEWAFAATGIFEGWDLSFHAANVFEDVARLESLGPDVFQLHHSRIWMGGAGGNFTWGSWLFKGELAYLDGIDYCAFDDVQCTDAGRDRSRLDALLGVEYYGLSQTTISVDIVNRHIFGFDGRITGALDSTRQEQVETAIRYTADFLNARLHVTALAVLFGLKAQYGSSIRLQADYDLRDALSATLGLLLYQKGKDPPISEWGRNDRVFFGVRWSF